MKPVRRIEPTPWMCAKPTRAVIGALCADGQAVRFVGGCVRDSLLATDFKGDFNGDIDIATPDRPEQVIALLDKAGIKNIPTGLAHGTITAVAEGQPFEITTLRVDVKSHGRHADVAFTDDWQEDAGRRDFTINALSCTPEGDIYDPWDGIKDLKAGRVRFVGDAGQRIEEDHLRLLRFFRFHAWFGTGAPDSDGLAACAAWAKSLAKLSGERIRNEMLKLLGAPDPAAVVEIMAESGVLAELLPAANDTVILRSVLTIEADFEPDPLRRLAALLIKSADDTTARSLAERWHLSNAEGERLTWMLSPPPAISAELNARALRREIYAHGGEKMIDWLFLGWAKHPIDGGSYRQMIKTASEWRPPTLPVKGADALDLGLQAGRHIGDLLNAVEKWWIEEDFTPARAECLDKLRALAAAQES